MVAAPAELTHRAPPLEIIAVDGLDEISDDWRLLAAADRNLFATWEWNELWWRHHARGRELRVTVARRGDEAVAIVPLFVWAERPLRILRLLGHGHGDHLGPICDQGDLGTAARVFRLALDAEEHDLFVGDWLAGDPDRAREVGGRVVRTTGYPVLRFADRSWAALLAGQSTRFRKSVRHSRNRLDRRHRVSFRSTELATLEQDLDTAFRLHRARFGSHEGCRFCGEHEAFQREFAALALERGWLRLLFLELDGAPVAAEYGFLFQGAYFAYQGGRDPAWDRESVGFLLEVENIRRSLEEGAVEYRFLGGEEPYKYRFPTEDPRLETVVAPASRRGSLAAAVLDAAWRLPGGRTLLRRIG